VIDKEARPRFKRAQQIALDLDKPDATPLPWSR
jgi:hypothetical protein